MNACWPCVSTFTTMAPEPSPSLVLGVDPDDLPLWAHLESRTAERGRAWDGGPLRAPAKADHARPLVAAELYVGEADASGCPTPLGLGLADARSHTYTDLVGTPDPGILLLTRLRAWSSRGSLICFWRGAREAFHVLLRTYCRDWVGQGWSIQPLAVSTAIRCLFLTRESERIALCDVEAMTGIEAPSLSRWCARWGQEDGGERPGVVRMHAALSAYQSFLLRSFGVGACPTLGMVAVRAFRRCLPAEPLWLRPPPGLVALCRAGRAYRGGWVYAEPYQGKGWRVDANKLYTWSLSQGVPVRAAIGRCDVGNGERTGIYVCRVGGRSLLPVRLPVWHGGSGGVYPETRYHWRHTSVLCEAEFEGLRALGLRVEPLWGWVFADWLRPTGFTDRLFALQSLYPRGHPAHAVTKLLGNAVVGKLGESPERLDVRYALDLPGDDWWPYLTWEGRQVPYLWVRRRYQPSAHQRVDAAAVITARGRSRVQAWAAEWLHIGGRVVHVDTDGLLLTSDPRGLVALDDGAPGQFRLEAVNVEATVLGRKTYSLDGVATTAGASGLPASALAIAYDRGSLVVERQLLHAPWLPGPMVTRNPLTLRTSP